MTINLKNKNVYNEISKLSKETLSKIAEENGVAISIAVMDNCKFVYSDSFGVADRVADLKTNEDTLFNIGSISKTFTAAAIMALVDEVKINLDEKVIKYLPEFKMADERYKDITVRMLLNHSSGLGGYYDVGSGYAYNQDENKFLIENAKDFNLSFDPGYANVYNNNGYSLLELIIEKVSGEKFIDFVNKKISIPLNLKNTGLGVGQRENNIAKFYDKDTNKAYPNEIISMTAAGGLSSTATDLCLFGRSFCNKAKKILSKASINEMAKQHPTPFSDKLEITSNFGLGWDVVRHIKNSNKTATIINKGGNTPHYSSNLIVVPEHGIVIAIVMTSNKDGCKTVDLDILNILLKSKGYEIYSDLSSEVTKIPEELKKFEGYYTNGYDMSTLLFDQEKDILTVTSLKNSEDKAIFNYYSDGYFKLQIEHENSKYNEVFYFKEVDRIKYFVATIPKLNCTNPVFHEIRENKNIKLSESIENKIWLRRNPKPYQSSQDLSSHVVLPRTLNLFPGYIEFFNLNKVQWSDFATFSSILRERTEFKLFRNGTKTWINCNGIIYAPDDVCKKLITGKNSVVIEDKSYSEWLVIDKNCSLDLRIPANGRVAVFDSKGKLLYDNIINTGGFSVIDKCYVECIGNSDDEFVITVS